MEEDKKEEIVEIKKEENSEKEKVEETKKEKKGFCISALVLGFISLVFFCLWYISIPCGILAIIFGILGIKSLNKGMAIAGLVTGAIGLVISSVIIIFLFVVAFSVGFSNGFNDSDFDFNKYNIISQDFDI